MKLKSIEAQSLHSFGVLGVPEGIAQLELAGARPRVWRSPLDKPEKQCSAAHKPTALFERPHISGLESDTCEKLPGVQKSSAGGWGGIIDRGGRRRTEVPIKKVKLLRRQGGATC